MKKPAIFLFWLLVWQAASIFVKNSLLLVGPADTLFALAGLAVSRPFWSAVGFSVFRIGLGVCLAFAAGLLTGSLAFVRPFAGALLALPVRLMKSIPVASFVILALIWTGSKNLSVFISFVVVYPIIHVTTESGLAGADKKLLEMAQVFRIPAWKRALCLYRPALGPYLSSACKTALGMGFKSGIAAEVIGVPAGSIGEGLYMAKIYLSTAELFAWTLTIILVSAAFEKVFLLILKECMRER
ncbi:MAG: nitrate ABC transporter permease [Lachnospiraceae bacterium]|nr:nitrate ABC transporter permease [Lachnospiraceae bacterium]